MSPAHVVEAHLASSHSMLRGRPPPSEAATPSEVPSSPDEIAGVGRPGDAARRGPVPAPVNSHRCILEPSQPLPLPSSAPQPLPTPLSEDLPDLSLSFAGSALPPTDVSLPTPPLVKNAYNLRLPSFHALGIAAPHPDRIALVSTHSFTPLGAGPLSKPEDPLHALSPPLASTLHLGGVEQRTTGSPEAARAKVEYLLPIVTPPNEPGTFNWGSFVVRTAGLGSPPSSEPGVSPNIRTGISASSPAPVVAADPLSVSDLSDALGMAAWIEKIKELITSDIHSLNADSVKVLSHALPCPSTTGHLFGQIIARIHDKTLTPTSWINVFHAVPGRFTVSDLPKSPPSTPGPAVGGDEYFTSKIFDSAVAVPDYQLNSKLLPPSPRPVVPPGSVNISIVERYIPATNTNEFSEMFQLRGRSLLYDRLAELSYSNGLLLFIYPTKTGGKTFMSDYLGPILDPLLRSLTVVNDLSSDLGKSLGQMVAIDHLCDYDDLRTKVEIFCHQLSASPDSLKASKEQRATYSVIHGSKEEYILERDAWAGDWWVKQEKPRVRELVTKYFRKKMPSSELTPTNLIQEVLDGVAYREYTPTQSQRGVEVGVFIIKKSS